VSLSSWLEKMTSIREGSSCGVNARLTKRPQAVVEKGMISTPYEIGGGGLQRAHRSQTWGSWRCRGVVHSVR